MAFKDSDKYREYLKPGRRPDDDIKIPSRPERLENPSSLDDSYIFPYLREKPATLPIRRFTDEEIIELRKAAGLTGSGLPRTAARADLRGLGANLATAVALGSLGFGLYSEYLHPRTGEVGDEERPTAHLVGSRAWYNEMEKQLRDISSTPRLEPLPLTDDFRFPTMPTELIPRNEIKFIDKIPDRKNYNFIIKEERFLNDREINSAFDSRPKESLSSSYDFKGLTAEEILARVREERQRQRKEALRMLEEIGLAGLTGSAITAPFPLTKEYPRPKKTW